ncbi:MAG: glycosyltransferase family 8 protein [Oscillospiraceae bacterium]|nr:glycosyltransferase family 8 protein [Oscillospiraceae bacterium]
MNILYTCDDKFCAYTGISITSLFENNKDLSEINVFIAGQGISEENSLKLQKTAEKYGRKIIILDAEKIDKFLVENNAVSYHESKAPYYRLFIDELLPQSIERILYIDSDSVVTGSLSGLESFIFEPDKVCAMKRDPVFAEYKISIGLNENDVYYHSGVMLFDLNNWRRLKCSDLLIKEIKEGRARYRLPDQDLLSRALNKNIQTLDLKYNFLTHIPYFGIDTYRAVSDAHDETYYTVQQMQEAMDNPVILHCVRGFVGTPWEKGNTNPFKEEWTKYKEMSLWVGIKETPSRTDKHMAVQRLLIKILPKKLYIPFHKIYSKRKHAGFVNESKK